MNSLQLALYPEAIATPANDAGVRDKPQGLVKEPEKKVCSVPNPQTVLEAELGRIFPVKEEENRIQMARRIMGSVVSELTDEELDAYLTEFQFLINYWLDCYEKQVFEGRKLEELLKEG